MAEPIVDGIARILASPIPRRRALRLISGGLVGAAFAHLAGRPASAQKFFTSCSEGGHGGGGNNGGGHRGRCTKDEFRCGADCCREGREICVEGKCCPTGSETKLCGGHCCPEGSTCADGRCCPQGREVCDGRCCNPGEICGKTRWGKSKCMTPPISRCEHER